ncbi:MAG: MarR family transcriptional regulator [Rhodospirillales bacterium]|nr:MarR family transcriptional regulator [Rhodospirillales bacterium]
MGYHMRRAQLRIFQDFAETMRDVQITPGQFGVLALIASNPGMTQSACARAVGIERSTMVAVIDALEQRKLVERRPSPVDKRSYALVLTMGGIKLMEELRPLVRRHEDRLTAGLSGPERRQLIDLLRRLSAPKG